jgi:hypothetical protein
VEGAATVAKVDGSFVTGGLAVGTTSKSTAYTATTANSFILVDTTSGNVTITLPAVASSAGTILLFKKKVAANTVTIQAHASETIDGNNTQTITSQYGALRIICDGSSWWII